MPKLPWQDRWAIEIAFAFGVGKLPKAPGTFGSIPGLALGAVIHRICSSSEGLGSLTPTIATCGSLVLLSMLALWAIKRTEAALGIHDDSRIVIDEVAGQAIAVAFVHPTPLALGLGFILFRFFDILKPGPIGYCDRNLPGALGTLTDDLLAGIVVALILTFLPTL